MKRKRFSIEQTVAGLKQAELGMPVVDLIRLVNLRRDSPCGKYFSGDSTSSSRHHHQTS